MPRRGESVEVGCRYQSSAAIPDSDDDGRERVLTRSAAPVDGAAPDILETDPSCAAPFEYTSSREVLRRSFFIPRRFAEHQRRRSRWPDRTKWLREVDTAGNTGAAPGAG